MTKEVLEQYVDLIKEINKLEKRIDRLNKQSEFTSDVVQNGYKRHAVIHGYDCNRAYKIHTLESILKERREIITKQEIEIEQWINNIEKSDIRQIFEHKYIDRMNWLQIQIEMQYRHEDTARKKHDKFLKENL